MLDWTPVDGITLSTLIVIIVAGVIISVIVELLKSVGRFLASVVEVGVLVVIVGAVVLFLKSHHLVATCGLFRV